MDVCERKRKREREIMKAFKKPTKLASCVRARIESEKSNRTGRLCELGPNAL